MLIRDRVKELRRVKASELRPNPRNWRTHPKSQQDALRGVLAEVGFAGAALARELGDGSLELIDGHLRADTIVDQEIPVLILDVTEAEANKLLATYDPLASMAEANPEKLESLLHEVQTGSSELAAMLTGLAEEHGIILDGEDGKATLKTLNIKPPPAMTWVLVGIPTVRFGEIAGTVEAIAKLPETIVESCSNDG